MLKTRRLILGAMCLQLMAKELVAVNAALHQTTRDCDQNSMPRMVDGNKDPKNTAEIKGGCGTGHSWINIFLSRFYSICFVVVYAGESSYITNSKGGKLVGQPKNTKPGQLDYFTVIVGYKNNYAKCSDFWGPSFISDDGMRVNCEPRRDNYNMVLVRSTIDEGFSICEIEVNTFETIIPGEKLRIFRGCFKRFGNEETKVDRPVFSSCQERCFTMEYVFFAVKDRTKCHCASTYDDADEISQRKCSLICDDGENFCGGDGIYSVYLVSVYLPVYKGCFVYPSSPSFLDDMTTAKCIQQCDDVAYAMLLDGKTCICTNNINMEEIANNSKCDSKCSGDSSDICGGNGFVAVYETCKKKSFPSLSCSKLMRCNNYDKYGRCKDACKSGFLGDYCMRRDPSYLDNQNTSQNVTLCKKSNPCMGQENTHCLLVDGKEICSCNTGYSKSTAGICEDIDECEFETCDIRYTVCKNLNGSYICECKPGYSKRKSIDICLAYFTKGEAQIVKEIDPAVISIFPLLSLLIMGLFFSFRQRLHSEAEVEDEDENG